MKKSVAFVATEAPTKQAKKQNKGLLLIKIAALSFALAAFSFNAKAQIGKPNAKIKVYFTQPINTAISTGVNAVSTGSATFDTLGAYINRAKYTVDIAQYEYQTLSGTDPIKTAINAAYARGVKIRYIQDYSQSSTNTGFTSLTSAIPKLTSPNPSSTPPCGGSYNIMHNKFIIIDVNGSDTNNAFVLMGSPDWDNAMQGGDYNNEVVFQSRQLAKAYTNEFDIMWGDTTHGGASNSTNSKFGPCKPATTQHIFYIGGSKVELYFSPSDGVNNEIVSTIATASRDLYCGMFTFTETTDATDIVNQKTAGAKAYVILDNYSSGSYTPYTSTFPSGLGSDFTGFVSSNYLYHNKYLIVNPSAPCDDPKVLTGSHNWTSSANSENDENTVIIHNDTVANIYLQAFSEDFKVISGNAVVAPTNTCAATTGINSIENNESAFNVFPNPVVDVLNINVENAGENLSVRITDQLGRQVLENTVNQTNEMQINTGSLSTGVYFVTVTSGNNHYTKKIVK
jgi:phosphatidylserine/phosphatidylglycerophosphate/cardiolipin synthase-like enzyme